MLGIHVEMRNNSTPGKAVPRSQHEQFSDYGGPEVGRGHGRLSQRTHENRSRHDGHLFPEDSSTSSGSSRLGGRNEQGDGKHY